MPGAPTSMGVELMMAPSTAGLPMEGSPSSQRATRSASTSVAPRPRVFKVEALLMAPVDWLTSNFTMVVPFEVQTLRFFQKVGSAAALKDTVWALQARVGVPELVS